MKKFTEKFSYYLRMSNEVEKLHSLAIILDNTESDDDTKKLARTYKFYLLQNKSLYENVTGYKNLIEKLANMKSWETARRLSISCTMAADTINHNLPFLFKHTSEISHFKLFVFLLVLLIIFLTALFSLPIEGAVITTVLFAVLGVYLTLANSNKKKGRK